MRRFKESEKKDEKIGGFGFMFDDASDFKLDS